MQNSICILLWIGGLCQTTRNGNRHHEFIHLYDTNIRKGERKGKRKSHFQFDSAEPHPIFYKYSETRPNTDGFRKNNVNYWVFREIGNIILHL